MAKFTKTTEIDISAMHEVVEETTPKKSKFRLVLSIVVSVIIAFIIWVAATEISTDLHEKTIEDVSVVGTEEKIDITVKGTFSALADVKKENIIVEKNDDGSYEVSIENLEKSVEIISPSQK